MKSLRYLVIIHSFLFIGCSPIEPPKSIEPDEVIRRHIQALNEKNQRNAEMYLVKDRRNIMNWQFDSQKSIRLASITPVNDPELVKNYHETGRGSISHPADVRVFKVELIKEYDSTSIITKDVNIWYYYVIKPTDSSPWLIDDWGI